MKRAALVPLLSAATLAAIFLAGQAGCGVRPAPVPTPVPVPVPVPPAPDVPPAGVVIVEDTAAADQARGLFLTSKKVQAFFKASGLGHAVFSTNTVGPDGKPVGGSAGQLINAAVASGQLPYLFVLDGRGKILREQKCPLDPDEFVALFDRHKGPRAMGCELAKPRLQWKEFGSADAPTTKLIPRPQWRPVDLEAFLPPVHDQDGRGQCNASATCTAIEACREVQGMGYVYLSGGDLYSQINGGRDRGSLLEDGLAAATMNGVAAAKTVPYVWDGRSHGGSAAVQAERRNYRVAEAYLCPTFDHMASALQQGFVIVHGLMWHDNFRPDADGWLPARGRGNGGGHALCGYGLAERGGVWGVRTRNSWGPTWGVGGNCVIPETLFDGGISGYWAVRSCVRTPEPFPPAEPARRVRLSLDPAESLQLAP